MSITPSLPNNFKTRDFWQRPEGKLGAAILFLGILGGLWGLYFLLPFLITLTENLMLLGLYLAGIFVVGSYLWASRHLIKNVFQMSMRWLTGLVIEIDPIGILKNNLDQMQDKKRELDTAITKVAGGKKQLELSIAAKRKDVNHIKDLVDQLDRQLSGERDPLRRQTLSLQRQGKLTEAGLKMNSSQRLQSLLDQTNKMYNLLQRWSSLADFQITNTTSQVETLAEERSTILKATVGLNAAKRIIKGDPEQLKLVNQTLEYLAEDTANKLGDMEDFARVSEKYLNDMDLENGAASEEAEQMFSTFENKLLGTGSAQTLPVMNMSPDSQGVYQPVERKASSTGNDDYSSLLK